MMLAVLLHGDQCCSAQSLAAIARPMLPLATISASLNAAIVPVITLLFVLI